MDASKKSVSDFQYLIIGGTTKAATTSLFTYLADHPLVCAASYKETRFFLNADYPLPSKYRYNGDVEQYNALYSQCSDSQLRLESTPDYLYCSSALERMSEYLPQAKLIFSLREPISRLISWYRYARQIGKLPDDISINDYVDRLFKNAERQSENKDAQDVGKGIDSEQFMQVLPQGRYAFYLKPYADLLGKDRVHILYFEHLTKNPYNVMKEICRFAEIEPNFFQDYTFKVTNRTETMRNSGFHQKYRAFRFKVRRWTHNKPLIHKPLRAMRRKIEPIYLRFNTRPDELISISDETKNRLVEYYKQDSVELGKLLGKQPPWDNSSM